MKTEDRQQFIRKMLLSDGGPYALSTAMAARSGSGKTTLLTSLVNDARKDPAFAEQTFLYVSVKGEHLWSEKTPVETTVDGVAAQVEKGEGLIVFYPPDPTFYEADVDEIIEMAFLISERKRKEHARKRRKGAPGGVLVIIDDANVLRGFDSRGQPSGSVKKLSIAGRSAGVRGLFITHRVANLPRLMNGNLSGLVLLSISNMDLDYSRNIFGQDFTELLPELKDYRWAYVDLITEETYRFNPVMESSGH